MSRLYKVDAGCNDQNGLALAFFRAGYYTSLILASARAGRARRAKDIAELKKALHMAQDYSTLGTRAYNAVSDINRHLQAVVQVPSSRPYVRQAQLLYAAVRALARVDADAEDPARTWLLIGLMAGDNPVGVKGKTVQQPLRGILASVITDVRQMTAIENDVKNGQRVFDVLDLWLVSNAEALWEPSNKMGISPRFNGTELHTAEYDVLAFIRKTAYYKDTIQGITATRLRTESGHPGASNILSKLRKYPGTKIFLNSHGSALFIRDAPMPPTAT